VRTIKLFAVIGLAVALVGVWATAQGQQQATVTINVKCQQNQPVADPSEAKLKRGETVAWAFDAQPQLNNCVSGVQSVRITFDNNNHPFQLTAQQQHPFILNLTSARTTLGPFTVKPDASPAQYPYKIEFFSQQNPPATGGSPISTISGRVTVIEVTPTLTEWGLIALAVLLAGGMGYMIYRRRPALRPAAP
jgi:plastocyanin